MTQGCIAHVKRIGLAGEVTRNFHPGVLQYRQPVFGASREDGVNARIVRLYRRPKFNALRAVIVFDPPLQLVNGELAVGRVEIPHGDDAIGIGSGNRGGTVVAKRHKLPGREVWRTAAFQVNAVETQNHVELRGLPQRAGEHRF